MSNVEKELPLISVIVPVYNVEHYLNKCIKSIINQKYTNLEILLIDDGSTDGSGAICEQYALLDDRIKVFHKANGGLSDARNYGIDRMNGEFVTFIDSDDSVSKFYVNNLYTVFQEDIDISMSWFENIIQGNNPASAPKEKAENIRIVNPKECYESLLYQKGVETSAWGKLYRKKLFQDVRYPVGKLYEDIPITMNVIHKCRKIAIISNIDYYYLHRKNAIQYTKFNPNKMQAIDYMWQACEFIRINYPELINAAWCRYFCISSNILFQIKDKTYNHERQFLWGEIKKYRYVVLKNHKASKKARLAAAISYMGYNITSRAYHISQMRGKI